MTDRVPGAPGQYKAVITEAEFQKMQTGEQFIITMIRDDHPIIEGTPYSKAAVLPDELAQQLCPNIADPAPADALIALADSLKNMHGLPSLSPEDVGGIGGFLTSANIDSATTQGIYYTDMDNWCQTVVFTSFWATMQIQFAWDGKMRSRIKWGNNWSEWNTYG